MHRWLCLFLVLLAACPPPKLEDTAASADADADGVAAAVDCDDSDPAIGAPEPEVCNGLDDDCDGEVDEELRVPRFEDQDEDGAGGAAIEACPDEGVEAAGDCDDANAEVFPGAEELCNGLDDDCDEQVDEGVLLSFYGDADGDGYGDELAAEACTQPPDTVARAGDCDDSDPQTHPGAVERCDGADNDCDEVVDEDPVDASTWYADADADGHGDPSETVEACAAPAGYVAAGDDCDDARPEASPGADELCNELDDDCDAQVDEDPVDPPSWHPDGDGDGFGDAESTTEACEAPSGWIADGSDCDDASAAINPLAVELCNGVDDDCDASVDESDALDAETFYEDADGDGYGAAAVEACEPPSGYVATGGDCDDAEPSTYPGAVEYCDAVDSDCDGATSDPEALDPLTWYADADGDGYGDAAVPLEACERPLGYVDNAEDCDDSDLDIGPGESWYPDVDGDGFGDESAAISSCEPISGYLTEGGDCDDGDPARNPDTTWFRDDDGDGFGDDGITAVSCEAPAGSWSLEGGDCNPAVASIHPGAAESCDAVDSDCDGESRDAESTDADVYYLDADGDGAGDPEQGISSCDPIPGYVGTGEDCDDSDPLVAPGLIERCDGLDNDCNELIDDDPVDPERWYTDADGDGWGTGAAVLACEAPSGMVADNGDCEDADPALNPDTLWYRDTDGDGYGDDAETRNQCASPGASWVLEGGDCEPALAGSYPGATEQCVAFGGPEGVDNDCDGLVDEDCPEEHCGAITADESWAPNPPAGHLISCTVEVIDGARLSIEDGVQLVFAPGTALEVGVDGDGALEVQGLVEGVRGSGEDPSAGSWEGLRLGARDLGSELRGLQLEHPRVGLRLEGAEPVVETLRVLEPEEAGLRVSTGVVRLDDVVVEDSRGAAVELDDGRLGGLQVELYGGELLRSTADGLVIDLGAGSSVYLEDTVVRDGLGAGVVMRGEPTVLLVQPQILGQAASGVDVHGGDLTLAGGLVESNGASGVPGLQLRAGSALAGLAGTVITGSGGVPLRLEEADALAAVDDTEALGLSWGANQLTGNADDRVQLSDGRLSTDLQLEAVDVPLWLEAGLLAEDVDLSIRDNQLQVGEGAQIIVGSPSGRGVALSLEGSSLEPADPLASWLGMVVDPGSSGSIARCRFEASGGDNLLLRDVSVSVSDTDFLDAAAYGLYCEGGCASYDLSGNSFSGNAIDSN